MSKANWRFLGNEKKYISEVLRLGFKAGADGSFGTKLEEIFSKKHKVPFAIAVNSGTSALHVSLLALGCGPGDEVLVPVLTPLMCGLSIHYTGATPVYVDVDPETFLISSVDLERKITSRSKAIMAVHMYGGVCDMNNIMKIAKKNNLYVLEDCAQCLFGFDDKKRITGTIGDIGTWSFENSKQVTCGDGGVVTCYNKNLAKKIRKIAGLGFKTITAKSGRVRVHKDKFQNPDWERFDSIGFNYRINQLGAAVALAQTERLEYFIDLRVRMAKEYERIMSKSKFFKVQKIKKKFKHTFYTYSAKFLGKKYGIDWLDFRKKYMSFGGDGIYAASKLLHQEPIFKKLKIGQCFMSCRKKCGISCINTPVASDLQKKMMNFTTNQSNQKERNKQISALKKTLLFFGERF